jgi:uridylate kinase
MGKKRVLLKLTGEIFLDHNRRLTPTTVISIIEQIKQLSATHQFGIVIGGGNFFRGSEHGITMGLDPAISHQIGMLGTMMNGLMLKNLFEQHHLSPSLFCAVICPEIGKPIAQQTIYRDLDEQNILIFTGGTGNPFFTTDTAAILRALQMNAHEVWKGTTVDGIYSTDPHTDTSAQKINSISYADAIQKKLGILDLTAYAMAERYQVIVRVFNIFAPNALREVAHNSNFGSTIS